MWIDFNFNQYVRVKLTDHGRAVHRRNYDALASVLSPSARNELPYQPPIEDADGWSKWQLWHLLREFGPSTWLTAEPCFEGTIQFEKE